MTPNPLPMQPCRDHLERPGDDHRELREGSRASISSSWARTAAARGPPADGQRRGTRRPPGRLPGAAVRHPEHEFLVAGRARRGRQGLTMRDRDRRARPSATTSTSRGWCSATARWPVSRRPTDPPTATRCGASSTICRRSRGGAVLHHRRAARRIMDRLADAHDQARAHARRDRYCSSDACSGGDRGQPTTDRRRRRTSGPDRCRSPKWRSPSTIAFRAKASARCCSSGWPRSRRRHGFRRFQATTLADNAAMLEVFRDSGFEIRSKVRGGHRRRPVVAHAVGRGRRDGRAQATRWRPRRRCGRCSTPRAVAVIGASRDAGQASGGRILDALRRRRIHGTASTRSIPTAAEIAGLPCFRSARELPAGVDLAVVAVPRGCRAAGVVDDCAAAGRQVARRHHGRLRGDRRRGPRAAAAARRERRADYGMRMVGPNCMGAAQHASPDGAPERVVLADLSAARDTSALSSQSGALGLAILGWPPSASVGLSTFVSVGNKADVSGNDLLEYWEEDPADPRHPALPRIVRQPAPVRAAWRAASRGQKPIVAVKAGRTARRSRAAGSHTAALAASDTAVDALFHQSGVIRADTIDEMFDIAACSMRSRCPAGSRVAIVTNAGGPGHPRGRRVRSRRPDRRRILARRRARGCVRSCPPTASVANPVDMVASAGPERIGRPIEVALASPDVDAAARRSSPPVDRVSSDDNLHSHSATGAARRQAAPPPSRSLRA